MAEKRMFAQTITESDAFLDLSHASQCLYFHLSMIADDDGFVNSPKKVVRMIGATDADFEQLVDKNFIILFKSGIICIKHWKINNYIQSDRHKATEYQEEFKRLSVKANKAYTTRRIGKSENAAEKKENVSKADTQCIQPVSKADTQIRLDLDKTRLDLDKTKEEKSITDKRVVAIPKEELLPPLPPEKKDTSSPKAEKPEKHKHGEYGRILLTDAQYSKLCEEFGIKYIDQAISNLDNEVQITDNKNKYKDFNLVIRKAIKNNWSIIKDIPKEDLDSSREGICKKLEKFIADNNLKDAEGIASLSNLEDFLLKSKPNEYLEIKQAYAKYMGQDKYGSGIKRVKKVDLSDIFGDDI